MSKIFEDYSKLSRNQKQKITQGSIIPRPIAWISSINENGSINLAPFSYFAVFSPTLLAVSFTKEKDGYKDTYQNLMSKKEAVVNLGDVDLLEQLDKTSKDIAYNESELDLVNLSLGKSQKIKTPYINESKVSFEVKVVEAIQFDDGEDIHDNDVVFLRIVAAHLHENVYDQENGYILEDVLKPISRLSGPKYGTVKTIDYKRKHTS